MVEIGDLAPDFTLRGHAGEDISLSQYLGQNHVVLSFHPASFTGG
jgi:peroxiredoxin